MKEPNVRRFLFLNTGANAARNNNGTRNGVGDDMNNYTTLPGIKSAGSPGSSKEEGLKSSGLRGDHFSPFKVYNVHVMRAGNIISFSPKTAKINSIPKGIHPVCILNISAF